MTAGDAFEALAIELERLFYSGATEQLTDAAFGDLALRVFAHQLRTNPVYAAFCQARGVREDDVGSWRDVPAVPASGFKYVDLLSASAPEAVFLTSGTTDRAGGRGRHLVPRLSLYRASYEAPFRRWVLPEGRCALISSIPSPAAAPESSLSTMIGMAADAMATRTWWLADDGGLVSAEAFRAAVSAAAEVDGPLLVVGTAFGLVHLLDGMRDAGTPIRLPVGTRIMETGGFKGRSRQVSRASLRDTMDEWLGVPPDRVVGEYGMTELLSQLYEPVLEAGPDAAGTYRPPPWMRVRALDPSTLEELPDGMPGLLCFHDLANLGSVAVVLTEDVGSVGPQGVRLQGRVEGAEPRGCSLAVEDLLGARGKVG